MSRLPVGTVTFLLTDIEGSTRLWQEHPDAMKVALARHHDLLKHAIESNGGYVFQIIGDAFCAAFHTPQAAIAAALAAQHTLLQESWGETGPIRVRMALHTGTAEVRAGDYKSGEYVSGLTMSRAARLLVAGHGGQILVSNATRELVRDQLVPATELRDLGEHRLRDLARPERIFQLLAPDLRSTFPSLKSLSSAPNNLPIQLTTFVGREREMSEVNRLLAATRLLTVTGAGGSGKTRLALEVAADLVDAYPDGAWLVELAAVADAALTPQVVASTLGLREEIGRPWLATLVDHLRPKRVLLALDNCEHVIEACARLAEAVLHACPEVTILATSREPLGVTGEITFRVPSLSLPETHHVPPLERTAEYEALRLFVDRATAVQPAFSITNANLVAVVHICRRLDGIPLAIELAAARLRAMSVHQISAHLDERFRFLTVGSRTTLPRHQTLRGSIDWSYDLLSDGERALFRRLSVFPGSFTLDAVEAACTEHDVDRGDVLDLLGRLVDKSLVLMNEETGDTRYRLLETIRQYGLEKLTELSEGAAARDRHRDFYLGFAEETEERLRGPEQAIWLKRLEADHDNLRAALQWSLEQGDIELALRLGGSLWLFWDTRGYISEAREWLDDLLARAGHLPGSALTPMGRRARAKVLDGAAYMRARLSELPSALELSIKSLAEWRELADKAGIAEALNNVGWRTRLMGNRARARSLVEESLALFRELADARGIAHALNNLAEIVLADGDQTRARDLFEESVRLFTRIEDKRGLSHALNNLGDLLTRQGEYRRAEASYGEVLRLAEELDDKHAMATVLRSLGRVAHQQRDYPGASRFYEDSIDRFRSMNDKACLARSLVGFALALHAGGDHGRAGSLGDEGVSLMRDAQAKGELVGLLAGLGRAAPLPESAERALRIFRECLALQHELGDMGGVAATLDDLARTVCARGQITRAMRLLAAADTLRQTHDVGLSAADRDARDRLVSAARAELDARIFERVWSEGATMTVEQAIAAARDEST